MMFNLKTTFYLKQKGDEILKYYYEYTQEFIEPICTLPHRGSFSDISYAINDHIN